MEETTMPTDGLSLVGFMDQTQAIHHLTNACVPANPDPAILVPEWAAAATQLGAATANAGNPNIQPIPAAGAPHIQQLIAQQPFQPAVPPLQPQGVLFGAAFQMVEIDPLLAFQFTVDIDRSNHHSGVFSAPPTLDELLHCCLPLAQTAEAITTVPGQASVILKARSLNVRAFNRGVFNGEFMGISFGVSLPYVQVVRYNNRCYLHNGFHRAYGARMAGATHVPCVFRDVASAPEVGIHSGTFPITLLESNDPPTVAHFTQNRSHAVRLRAHSRFLHVSWAEYVIPDE
jgi:hypothetical protein